MEGPQALRVSHRTDALLPAHVTSGGKPLLAELPPERLRTLYPNGLPRGGSEASGNVQRLAAELTTIRRTGWALNLQESERGVNAVGACAAIARYGRGRRRGTVRPLSEGPAEPTGRCGVAEEGVVDPHRVEAGRAVEHQRYDVAARSSGAHGR
ncbi:IclR family transcriptional regulator C-terminal domain-containing protein [Streptomyces qaidamensis]|uniref:IclR family transcriptional regulator domain-containing protein n=1 Tax=Streptomyces qaidamensis TaxID=1783515 RepID=UPI0036EC4EC4